MNFFNIESKFKIFSGGGGRGREVGGEGVLE